MSTNNSKLNTAVMVYVSTFDSDQACGEVKPASRNEAIQRSTDRLAKQQRYCVWKLLDYALHDCYGKGVGEMDLYLDDNGRWNCRNGVDFSLAHSNNVVAVAIFNHAVGLDLEAVSRFARHVDNDVFVQRVLTDGEQRLLRNVSREHKTELLAKLWTQKESIFKLESRSAFVPNRIDTTTQSATCQLLTINGELYALSVATHPADINANIAIVRLKY